MLDGLVFIMSIQCDFVLFQVWDDKIIESALKTFYNSDLTNMIQAIQQKIEVQCSFFLDYKFYVMNLII